MTRYWRPSRWLQNTSFNRYSLLFLGLLSFRISQIQHLDFLFSPTLFPGNKSTQVGGVSRRQSHHRWHGMTPARRRTSNEGPLFPGWQRFRKAFSKFPFHGNGSEKEVQKHPLHASQHRTSDTSPFTLLSSLSLLPSHSPFHRPPTLLRTQATCQIIRSFT